MIIPSYIEFPEQMLELICMGLDRRGIRFSKAMSARIVGGEYRLEKLVQNGFIRAEKPTRKQNGKWRCLAGDVLKNMKL